MPSCPTNSDVNELRRVVDHSARRRFPGLASPQAGLGGRGYTRKSRAHVADAATRRVSRNLNNGRDAGGEVLLSRAARTRRSGGWLV